MSRGLSGALSKLSGAFSAVGIPVGVGTAGATVTAGAFTGTVSLMPAYALPAYDKALKVQFGPVATLSLATALSARKRI